MAGIYEGGRAGALFMLLVLIILAACGPAPTQLPIVTVTPPTAVAAAPTQAPAGPSECSTSYTRHELTAPYQQDHNNPQPLYTMAQAEFSAALRELGISSVCVPQGVDAPYVKSDSKTYNSPAVRGRMVTYSFDAWREAQLVYSTYDIMIPTEFDKYASATDYDAMKNASTPGFERVMVGLCYGRCTVYKTFIYPFADHYVAVTLDLGAYEYGTAVEEQVAKFNAGQYPPELQDDLERFDTLVRGLEFSQ